MRARVSRCDSPLYCELRPDLLILDSPFASFPRLVDDLIKKGAIKIPRIAVKTVLSMVRSSVKKRTGADIYRLEPINDCPQCGMPALFVTADKDEMIPTEHGEALNSSWGGPSLQVTFHGGHNSPRPPHIYDAAGTFLRAVLAPEDLGSGGGGKASRAVQDSFKAIQDLCDNKESDLPPGWLAATDPETGDTYYYDTFTHKTTWFRPLKPSIGFTQSAGGDSSSAPEGSDSKRRQGKKDGGAAAEAPAGGAMEKGEFGAFAGFGSPGGGGCGSSEDGDYFSDDDGADIKDGPFLRGLSAQDEEDEPLSASDLRDLIQISEGNEEADSSPPASPDIPQAKRPPSEGASDTNDAATVNLSLF